MVLLTPTSSRAAHDSISKLAQFIEENWENTYSQAAVANPERAFPDLPARLPRGADLHVGSASRRCASVGCIGPPDLEIRLSLLHPGLLLQLLQGPLIGG